MLNLKLIGCPTMTELRHSEFYDKEDLFGLMYFKDGHVETMGSINMLGGQCDCCPVDHKDIEKIEIYDRVDNQA